jgi:hypothetical protein
MNYAQLDGREHMSELDNGTDDDMRLEYLSMDSVTIVQYVFIASYFSSILDG